MQGRREQCPTQLSRFTQEQATSLAVCSGLTLAQQAMHTLWQLSEAPQWLAAMKINPARRSYMMQGDMKEEAEKRNLLHLTPFPGLTLWPSHTHQSHHVFIWHHGQSYPATPSCHGRLRSVKTTKPTHKYVVWWHKRWCNWIRFHTFLLASLLLQAHVCRCHGDDKNRAVFSVYDHLPRTSLQTGRAQRAHRHSLPCTSVSPTATPVTTHAFLWQHGPWDHSGAAGQRQLFKAGHRTSELVSVAFSGSFKHL